MAKRSKSKRASSRGYSKRTRYVPRAPVSVPDSTVVVMRYCTSLSLFSGALNFDEHVYRGGSIFDPDFTGVGQQPMSHDQWAQLYGKYRVEASRVKIWAVNNDTGPCMIVCTPTEFTTVIADGPTAQEFAYNKAEVMGEAGGNDSSTIVMPWIKTATFKGDKGAKYDSDYSASFGSNPALDFYYHVLAWNPTGTTSVSCTVTICIEYKVRMFDRVNLVGS